MPETLDVQVLDPLKIETQALVSRAEQLIAQLSAWRANPTCVSILIERARSRVARDTSIAQAAGITTTHLSRLKRQDATFKELYEAATYDEETAALLLAYFTYRGAHATIYDAVNGGRVMRAQVQAAQSVIELAERRRRAASGPDPMKELLAGDKQ